MMRADDAARKRTGPTRIVAIQAAHALADGFCCPQNVTDGRNDLRFF
jgi:hypothetical protein